MKKLLVVLTALFSVSGANAQTETEVDIQIINNTNCVLYVQVRPVDSNPAPGTSGSDNNPGGGCLLLSPQTVGVAPYGGVAYIPSIPGYHYEMATVFDSYPAPHTSTFYVKIQAPDASVLGWGGATSYCYTAGAYPQCDTDIGCGGALLEACWSGNAALPQIVINM